MSTNDDDFAFEPVRGLPAHLPDGERILWQGSPDWIRLAITAFHIRKVAIYFAFVAAWHLVGGGTPTPAALVWTTAAAASSIAILSGLAWLYARTTVYTLTTRRIVIRSGLTLPVTVNLPLARIDGAALRRHANGFGSIALTITPPNRVAYLVLWPNVRPFAFARPQPMLRAIADIDAVVPLVARALQRSGGVATLDLDRLAYPPAATIADAAA